MKITKSIIVNQPSELVWKVVAEEFDQAHLWMGPVKKSYAFDEGHHNTSAPVAGRVCELGSGPKGLKAEEVITQYNEKEQYLVFDVVPKNAPGLLPVNKNTVKMSVLNLGNGQSKVLWESTPDLKIMGKLLSPVLKIGLGKAFSDILKDLKHYCESQKSLSATANG